jgi:membrane protease YdiL (CAAX protease family)
LETIKSSGTFAIVLFSWNTIIIMPVIEEIIYRWLTYIPLYRKVGRYPAMLISAMIWSYVHFQPTLGSIGIFIIGIVLVWAYDKSGSLVYPVLLHIYKNSWILVHY